MATGNDIVVVPNKAVIHAINFPYIVCGIKSP